MPWLFTVGCYVLLSGLMAGVTLTSMPASPTPPDQFEQMFAEMDTPESKLKFEEDHRFLREVVYAGLGDLNIGFDSALIGHFSPADFLTVIDRCESMLV